MCGRFTMTYPDAHLLALELGVDEAAFAAYAPNYNVAPTDQHFIVRIKNETREVLPARWGLVNSWATDNRDAARRINARAETVATSGAFRDAFANRRCVVPTDGFYEWERVGKERHPSWFHRASGQLLFMAGLYESWQAKPGQWQRTFTIVTTAANGTVGAIHDRMPVILDERDADLWMFASTQPSDLTALLRPAPDGVLIRTAVSARVNSVKNNDASLVEPVIAQPGLL